MIDGGSLEGIEESVSEGISEMCGDGDEYVVIVVYEYVPARRKKEPKGEADEWSDVEQYSQPL